MKKQYMFYICFFVSLFILICGCTEEKPLRHVKDYAIPLDELPSGYTIHNEELDTNEQNMSIDIDIKESYKAYYWHLSDPKNTSSEPLFPAFHLFIMKCKDNNEASKFHDELSKNNQSDNDTEDITPSEVEKIGDESDYKLYKTESYYGTTANLTISFLGFRIENIYVYIMAIASPDMDVEITNYSYDLAHIVLDKIQKDYK
jgi:hypothetical protein